MGKARQARTPKGPFARVVPRGWVVIHELAGRYDADPQVQAVRRKVAERKAREGEPA